MKWKQEISAVLSRIPEKALCYRKYELSVLQLPIQTLQMLTYRISNQVLFSEGDLDLDGMDLVLFQLSTTEKWRNSKPKLRKSETKVFSFSSWMTCELVKVLVYG
jgi:hypothetical protein